MACGWRRGMCVIEHNHATKLVRGITCRPCNARLADIEHGQHEHFRYLFRFTHYNTYGNGWHVLSADLFKGKRIKIAELLKLSSSFYPGFRRELNELLRQGKKYWIAPPPILTLDDIEIVAVPCGLLHAYLEKPPLAHLRRKYYNGMRLSEFTN